MPHSFSVSLVPFCFASYRMSFLPRLDVPRLRVISIRPSVVADKLAKRVAHLLQVVDKVLLNCTDEPCTNHVAVGLLPAGLEVQKGLSPYLFKFFPFGPHANLALAWCLAKHQEAGFDLVVDSL